MTKSAENEYGFEIEGTSLVRCHLKEENIVVPDGIETICAEAFEWNFGFEDSYDVLKTVQLPPSVRVIERHAFSGRILLQEINLPEGLEIIGDRAFYACQSLIEIKFPNSIREIGKYAFGSCGHLKTVSIPHAVAGYKIYQSELSDGVLSLGIFKGCSSLSSFDIPPETMSIGEEAFISCKSLTSITIPESVTDIGDRAFYGCDRIKSVNLPSTVAKVGEQAFGDVRNKITVDDNNREFCSINGVLYSRDRKKLISCPTQYRAARYQIPEGVEEVSPYAFDCCCKIKRITIASTVRSIGEGAFRGMFSLTSVCFPKNFPIFEKKLFSGCNKLRHIQWPENLREIGRDCFWNTAIEKINIPCSVETIDSYAFADTKAKSVTLPKSVKKIGVSIFAGIPRIEVYDTIDMEAKPAAEHLDDTNGHPNGNVGFIGIRHWPNYVLGACNSTWYEHTIIVRSSKDDSIKYQVRMPDGQSRTVYCTYASSWGKNAEFNFCAIDSIFDKLTADAKHDYVIERLHWQEGITIGSLDRFKKYLSRTSTAIASKIFETDDVEELQFLEPYGIIKKSSINKIIELAENANAEKCKDWLIDTKNRIYPDVKR